MEAVHIWCTADLPFLFWNLLIFSHPLKFFLHLNRPGRCRYLSHLIELITRLFFDSLFILPHETDQLTSPSVIPTNAELEKAVQGHTLEMGGCHLGTLRAVQRWSSTAAVHREQRSRERRSRERWVKHHHSGTYLILAHHSTGNGNIVLLTTLLFRVFDKLLIFLQKHVHFKTNGYT